MLGSEFLKRDDVRVNVVQDRVGHMSLIVERNGVCPRCHGDGSEAVVLDWSEMPGWRCVNCGERLDPLIVANRRGAERRA
jgi:tRNA(Ile2) C34 agmatinyltransferase TiaS